jgi:hypothetical protein
MGAAIIRNVIRTNTIKKTLSNVKRRNLYILLLYKGKL